MLLRIAALEKEILGLKGERDELRRKVVTMEIQFQSVRDLVERMGRAGLIAGWNVDTPTRVIAAVAAEAAVAEPSAVGQTAVERAAAEPAAESSRPEDRA